MVSSDTKDLPKHPSGHVANWPDKPAYILEPSGITVTYRELEERSNRAAHLFRREGLKPGSGVVLLLENNHYFFELVWGAQRSGLRYTCVSSMLAAEEVEYILRDCGAKVLITSSRISEAERLPGLLADITLFNIGGERQGFKSYEEAVASMPITPIADQCAGIDMLYSSGTTGKPKGIRRVLDPDMPFDAETPIMKMIGLFGFNENTVYLSPAPLYHAAPLHWCAAMMGWGGTAIIMERFDEELALALIEKHRVNASLFVPTHFVRMLKMPEEERKRYDISSLETVVHAAAPCPVATKEAMIDWWGPVIYEFYSGTESIGMTLINSEEWLKKKGSVGRAVFGEIKICDEQGDPMAPGEVGDVYFANGPTFSYHNDEEKTAAAKNQHGWGTMGDVGYIDEDGYLFLSDRKSFMIISGGVNIYPQETENLLIQHPKVADVAVIGAPDDEMGERVVAVIQPAKGITPDEELARELIAYSRERLSHVKCPRQVDFMEQLPRHENGKLYKRQIRDQYWGGRKLIS